MPHLRDAAPAVEDEGKSLGDGLGRLGEDDVGGACGRAAGLEGGHDLWGCVYVGG